MSQDWTQTARRLKAVVIALGVLIAAGLVVIVVVVTQRLTAPRETSPAAGFATVALPAGARIVAMTGDGDALSLLVEGADGRQRILTVDRRTGAVLGTLRLAPGN